MKETFLSLYKSSSSLSECNASIRLLLSAPVATNQSFCPLCFHIPFSKEISSYYVFSTIIIKMQFTLVALLIGAVAASPAALLARLATRDSDPCSGTLYGISQCCSADVLGVADRDCSTRLLI